MAAVRRLGFRWIALAVAGAALAWPATARDPSLAMLGTLEKGLWALHVHDGGTERLCVRTGREFIQLRHSQTNCGRFVIEDSPDQIDVQYTCPAAGYGRTSVRRESRGLVQVQSRGIANGNPFAVVAEARHEGAC
jgi:hypothetical protein